MMVDQLGGGPVLLHLVNLVVVEWMMMTHWKRFGTSGSMQYG
jgi:hypothetical protein